ncbi:MAG: sulfite exporter TauE/SafE family protein [Methylomonas sp.]|jgi:hypothetical protein|uniref:sulfite exporter TauE/SafE family protein n=1 Tax=Methylomonas sp. TaxID=418 RepID=UPI0025FEDBE5|nr:sulfite exporter TauE/SafE family protein [Methylomonas sp.]MCK9605082.1 sulfite exporter TauE/SafE family protein [Methylomonas sp.]
MIEIFLASLLLGSIAGLSAGLFGIGGGVLVVPFLSWLFTAHQFESEQIMLMAVATALASALFTSAASVRTHFRLGNIIWPRALRLAPTLFAGAVCGATLAEYISAGVLRKVFIVYLLYTSLHMVLPKNTARMAGKLPAGFDYPIGLFVGSISAVLGIGGGSMNVPYLAHAGLPMKNAVATSSVCALPIAFSAAASYIFLGWQNAALPPDSFGYVYLPAFLGITVTGVFTAPIGAGLAHRLPARQLKRYFALILLLIALKMLG